MPFKRPCSGGGEAGCWPPLWPKLEKAFHALPPPAAGTSGLVTLRDGLCQTDFCSSTGLKAEAERVRDGKPPGASGGTDLAQNRPIHGLGEGAGLRLG